MKPTKPIPARVLLRLRDPRDSAEAFISLSACLFQNGLILAEPREVRRATTTSDEIELICTFVDPVAARTWLEHPAIRMQYGKLFEESLKSKPVVRRCIDVILEADRDRTCRCRRPSSLLLAGYALHPAGPVFCLDCNGAKPSYQLPDPYAAQSWAGLYKNVWDIWLDSGVLESWAKRQLGNVGSTLNSAGRDMGRKLARALGTPVYYLLHREGPLVRPSCPSCRRKGRTLERHENLRQCRRCRLVF